MDSTETEYQPTCTPDVRGFRQTAPVGVQGYVTGYLPNDRKDARIDADTVLAEVASPPRRSDTGVSRTFTITLTCEAWWDAATSGGIASRRTIDYELKFTPCPKGGRTTKGC